MDTERKTFDETVIYIKTFNKLDIEDIEESM